MTKSSKKQTQNSKPKTRARASAGGHDFEAKRRQISGGRRATCTGPKPIKLSKISSLTAMLQRPKGASIAELCKATGWRAHSVRGVISGVLKKKHGFSVSSAAKDDGTRVYRVIT